MITLNTWMPYYSRPPFDGILWWYGPCIVYEILISSTNKVPQMPVHTSLKSLKLYYRKGLYSAISMQFSEKKKASVFNEGEQIC